MAALVVLIVLVGVLVVVGWQAVRLRQLRRALGAMQSDLRRALARIESQDEASAIMRQALNHAPVPQPPKKRHLYAVKSAGAALALVGGATLVEARKHPTATASAALSTTLAAVSIALVTTAGHGPEPSIALPAPHSAIPTSTLDPTTPIPGPVVTVEPQTPIAGNNVPVQFKTSQRPAQSPVVVRRTSSVPSPSAPVSEGGGSQNQPPPPITSDPMTSEPPSPNPTPTPDPPSTPPGPEPLCVSALGILGLCVQL